MPEKEKTQKVRPVDRTVVLDIALDGRSERASHAEPAEVPVEVAQRLLASPQWESVGASTSGSSKVKDILAEVGDDPAKAAEALAIERARGSGARVTLVRRLEVLAAQAPAPAVVQAETVVEEQAEHAETIQEDDDAE
jgi:hypothetical protein